MIITRGQDYVVIAAEGGVKEKGEMRVTSGVDLVLFAALVVGPVALLVAVEGRSASIQENSLDGNTLWEFGEFTTGRSILSTGHTTSSGVGTSTFVGRSHWIFIALIARVWVSGFGTALVGGFLAEGCDGST